MQVYSLNSKQNNVSKGDVLLNSVSLLENIDSPKAAAQLMQSMISVLSNPVGLHLHYYF